MEYIRTQLKKIGTGKKSLVNDFGYSMYINFGDLPCRTMSLPSSPLDATEQQKLNVQRCGSNPFLLKEPPRYDEAIKNKQTVSGSELFIFIPCAIFGILWKRL